MPLIPLDNMPEALRRDDIALENFSSTPKEPQMHNNLNFGETMMFSSSGHRERTPNSMNAMIKHGKVRLLLNISISFCLPEVRLELVSYFKSCTFSHVSVPPSYPFISKSFF